MKESATSTKKVDVEEKKCGFLDILKYIMVEY